MNVANIRRQIEDKRQPDPFYATVKDAYGVVTDYDTFPYPRWYRGRYESSRPIVAEREAGWRPRRDNCYSINYASTDSTPSSYPNHCFSSACSVVFPCYPEYLQKFSDQKEMEIILNNACTIQYR